VFWWENVKGRNLGVDWWLIWRCLFRWEFLFDWLGVLNSKQDGKYLDY